MIIKRIGSVKRVYHNNLFTIGNIQKVIQEDVKFYIMYFNVTGSGYNLIADNMQDLIIKFNDIIIKLKKDKSYATIIVKLDKI